MKPAPFDLLRPRSLEEAVDLLAKGDPDAKVIAGGQSLGPMLNLRLARPSLLIDISAIPELSEVSESSDGVTVGSCVTTASLEDGIPVKNGAGLLASVARNIAYRAVRNRGTIGGSICHADPAADWVSTLSALGAECLVQGPGGQRTIAMSDFMLSAFQTALSGGEILRAVRIPAAALQGQFGYNKLCRKAGEFALAIGAALKDRDNSIRLVIGATSGRPIFLDPAACLPSEGRNSIRRLDEQQIDAALSRHGLMSPSSRRQHIAVLTRAVRQAAIT